MPGERFWYDFQDGFSDLVSTIVDSPWQDGDPDNQSGQNKIPQSGVGTDFDMANGGDTIVVSHHLTIRGFLGCGSSGAGALWSPIQFLPNAGSRATMLPTGNYRVRALVRCHGHGNSHYGKSESSVVALTQGVSKPRVIMPPLPNGCEYQIHLTNTNGAAGTECSYVGGTSEYYDLVSDKWFNGTQGPVVTYGPYSRPYEAPQPEWTGNAVTSAIPGVSAMFVDAVGGGRLTFLDGSLLLMRGDFYVRSDDTVTDDIIAVIGSGTWGFDRSLCTDPAKTEYREIYEGDVRISYQQ